MAVCFYLNFQFTCAVMELLDSDWPANILAGLNFRAQENRPNVVFELLERDLLGMRLAIE